MKLSHFGKPADVFRRETRDGKRALKGVWVSLLHLTFSLNSNLKYLPYLAKYKKGHVTNQNLLSRMGNQGELGGGVCRGKPSGRDGPAGHGVRGSLE